MTTFKELLDALAQAGDALRLQPDLGTEEAEAEWAN